MMAALASILFLSQAALHIANSASWDDNAHRSGICQQGAHTGPKVATAKYIRSIDSGFGWDEVEKKDNEFDFSGVESDLDSILKVQPDISILLQPGTGSTAPHWLYQSPINVPICYIKGGTTSDTTPWPYYLDKNYQTYWERYQKNVYNWVVNSKYYPKTIFAVQMEFGTTGDDSPWHGTPEKQSCDISNSQWWDFEKSAGQVVYDTYYNSSKNTVPYLLILANWGSDTEKHEYTNEHWPGVYRKNGQASHGYQLNEEYNDWLTIGTFSRNLVQTKYNISIRFRGESNTDQKQAGGWWKEAPYWNTFTQVQWALTYGVDFQGFDSGQIDNRSYDVALNFYNIMETYKHDYLDKPQAAFIGLHDGLDSNDTDRFPESKFGSANINNADRMVKIAQNMSEFGAKQQDPSHATGGPMQQRQATKLNDVGFGIWRDNYSKFIQQINAQDTSQGRWRIGDMNDPQQIYGRFGRSFDEKSGKTKMCFVFDKYMWGGLPLQKQVNLYWNVSYFDQGTGGWTFGYDSQNKNKMNDMVKKTNKNTWLVQNFHITDGYFGQRGEMKSDFCLYSNDTKDDTIFSFIQVTS